MTLNTNRKAKQKKETPCKLCVCKGFLSLTYLVCVAYTSDNGDCVGKSTIQLGKNVTIGALSIVCRESGQRAAW